MLAAPTLVENAQTGGWFSHICMHTIICNSVASLSMYRLSK